LKQIDGAGSNNTDQARRAAMPFL
jgi:hypothetical protein